MAVPEALCAIGITELSRCRPTSVELAIFTFKFRFLARPVVDWTKKRSPRMCGMSAAVHKISYVLLKVMRNRGQNNIANF